MQQMTSTQLYFRLLSYVKPYWGVFALSIVGMLITAATEVALPMAVKPFLDGTFVKKDPLLITCQTFRDDSRVPCGRTPGLAGGGQQSATR